jgi:acetolactate synthase regulatory subunit
MSREKNKFLHDPSESNTYEVEASMFVLSLRADDLYSVLERVLAKVRLAAVVLDQMAVSAVGGGYALRLVLTASDSAIVERLLRQIAAIFGTSDLDLSHHSGAPGGSGQSASSLAMPAVERMQMAD